MKTTLIVIQDETDHADAKKLIEKLMGSSDPGPCTDDSPGPLGRGLRALGVVTYSTDPSSSSRLNNGSA
jgi:hypothetical protein